MNTQPQPKFNMFQKLEFKGQSQFVVDQIMYDHADSEFRYGNTFIDFMYKESDLTLVKEPLKAEFECCWRNTPRNESIVVPCEVEDIVQPFIGKRTRVTVEEIL